MPHDAYLTSPTRGGASYIQSRSISNFRKEVRFSFVDKDTGREIQEKLHYIHSMRDDTIGHFGFFLAGYDTPFCYAAVSPCDRMYQREPVKRLLRGVSDAQILSMTRAYSFPPLPKNAMSKLFQEVASFYGKERQFGAIVTAINPLLGFKGSTFLGSSFIPYASSPMQYVYTREGHYVNRRHPDAEICQASPTPPIVWLARGLTRYNQKILDFNQGLHVTTEDEYNQG